MLDSDTAIEIINKAKTCPNTHPHIKEKMILKKLKLNNISSKKSINTKIFFCLLKTTPKILIKYKVIAKEI
jgi:hypothetical protein